MFTLESWKLRERENGLPDFVVEPPLAWVSCGFVCVEQHAAGEELSPLVAVHLAVAHQEGGAEQQREVELVLKRIEKKQPVRI